MPIAFTHRRQRQKNLVLLAILLVIIAAIFYLTMIRIAAFGQATAPHPDTHTSSLSRNHTSP